MPGIGWSGVLVLPYLAYGAFGVLVIVFALPMARKLSRQSDAAPVAVIGELHAIRRQAGLGAVRGKLDGLLIAAAQPAMWPAHYLMAGPSPEVRAVADARVRRPLPLWEGVVLCTFVAVIAMLVAADGQRWCLRLGCYAAIIAVLTCQLRLLLHGVDAREEMRRTLSNPFLQLGVIALTSFLTLVLAGYVLLHWPDHQPFRLPGLWLEARQTFGFGHLSAIWKARHAGGTQILLAITALSVYALLVRQLSNPLAFRRTDDDRVDIAIRLALAQQPEEAQEWLQRVERFSALSAEGLRANGLIALAAGRRDDALGAARADATLRRAGTDAPEDDDDARVTLLVWAQQFRDRELFAAVSAWSIESGIGDAALASIVPGLSANTWRALAPLPGRFRLTSAMVGLCGGEDVDPSVLSGARSSGVPDRLATAFVSAHLALRQASHLSWSRERQVATAGTRMLLNELGAQPLDRLPFWLRVWAANEIELRLGRKHLYLEAETTEALRTLRLALERRAPSPHSPLGEQRFVVPRISRKIAEVDVPDIGPVQVLGGPTELRRIGRHVRVFRYDLGYLGRVVPVYVHVARAAIEADRTALAPGLRRLIDTRGEVRLLSELRAHRIPKRIQIALSGAVRVQFRKR